MSFRKCWTALVIFTALVTVGVYKSVSMSDIKTVLAARTEELRMGAPLTLEVNYTSTTEATTDNLLGLIEESSELMREATLRINETTEELVRPAMKTCEPSNLVGRIKVEMKVPTLDEMSRLHPELGPGGYFHPRNCTPRQKVAIVIPFRDREEHLRIFLQQIVPMLQRQRVEGQIFLLEQTGTEEKLFNRAMLFNVGFLEALKKTPFDCFIFHDVDLIPEDDRNIYECAPQPLHMSVAIDKFKYRLHSSVDFGGVSAMSTEQFRLVNGFSNLYWGWGGEDDDMYKRIWMKKLNVTRRSPGIARYTMIRHAQQPLNNIRFKLLAQTVRKAGTDGLSSVKYTVDSVKLKRLFVHIRVQLSRI